LQPGFSLECNPNKVRQSFAQQKLAILFTTTL
jgi:hypothetical protein